MQNSYQDVNSSEEPSMIVSTLSSMRITNSQEPLNYLIFLLQSSVVLLYLSEKNT